MKSKITIGMNPDNDIVVDGSFDTVSGHHATISLTDTGYLFEDHSTNGSYINGQRVHNKTVVIRHGDDIRLSSVYSLTWRQIDTLLGTDCAPQPHDNRATQYQPQGTASYEEFNYSSSSNSSYSANSSEYKEPKPQVMKEPECIDKFNWGAFAMPELWALFNRQWWLFILVAVTELFSYNLEGLKADILVVSFYIMIGIIAGIFGNSKSWDKTDNMTAERFDLKQHRWNVAGEFVAILNVFLWVWLFSEYI